MSDNFREHYADEMQRSMDPDVHAMTVVDHKHRMNHDGFMYHASGKVTGMVDANVDDFLFVTGAREAHMQSAKLKAGRGDIDILVYEGTTTSDPGSALTELNTNRTSSNTPTAVLTFAPTVSGVGTLIHTDWIPPTATGTGMSGEGSVNAGQGEEWEFAPSTQYLIRITNNSGAEIDYRWEFLWYEPAYLV